MSVSPQGRHRKPRRRAMLAGTSAVVVAGAVLTGASALQHAGACTVGSVRVLAAPEIAPVVSQVASTLVDPCTRYVVRAAGPEEVASVPAVADVWITESSRWTTPRVDDAVSVASSPVVLAVPATAARGLGPEPTYDRLTSSLRLTAAAASTSAVTQAGLADLGRALSGGPAQRGVLTSLLRSLSERPGGTLVTTQVTAPATHTIVRPPSGGTVMDYPFVTVRDSAEASALRRALTGVVGRDALAQARFGPATDERLLTEGASAAALETLAVLDRPTRTLGVIDVSGSMAALVPGTSGATRMDLARQAIHTGLDLLPTGTVAGLWRFSSNLTPSTDYEQLAPLTELTPSTRSLLSRTLARLQVDPYGGTGLYSSTLAAVRHVRATFDPTRVNSVIVLSDGRDQDATAHNITLARLLRELRADADPARPVQVIGIAYGPDSDSEAMRAITDATGGSLYTARDPRDLPVIFREAVGNRLCGGDAC